MPTYVYRCAQGHESEERRSVAERDTPWVCPVVILEPQLCGASTTRIEIPSATPFITRPGVGDRSPFSRDRVGK